MLRTPRWELPYPEATDTADVPRDVSALALALDMLAADDQGLLANRPVSSPASPGRRGRYYLATDPGPGGTAVLYRDNGVGWDAIGPSIIGDGAVTAPKLADDAVVARAIADGAVLLDHIGDLQVGTAKVADKAITAAKVADALRPSAGAAGGAEALRALGTTAGTAARGDDFAAHVALTGTAHVVPFVAALPANPVDGQECFYLANGASGVVWHLKYRAADPSAYKWIFVGGSHLLHDVVTQDRLSWSAYADLPTFGPFVDVPLGGEYAVRWGATMHGSAPGANEAYMGISYGNVVAVDSLSLFFRSATPDEFSALSRDANLPAIGPGFRIRAMYRTSANDHESWFYQRFLTVRPIRVG